MRKLAVLRLGLVLCLSLFSHRLAAQVQCNCIANLDTTIKKTELNYAGYPDMIAKKLLPEYHRLVKRLRINAAKSDDLQKCFQVLKEYVIFFNDKHFDIEYSNNDTTTFKYFPLTEKAFRSSFAGKPRDSIEGIWINPDSSMKLAVYKVEPLKYQAVILESKDTKLKPGLIYYTFTKGKNGFIFDRYDWLMPDFPVRVRDGLLYIWNFELWGKIYPSEMTAEDRYTLSTWKNYNFGLDLRKLDQDNVLLTIGSFNRDDKIKALIQKNDSLIRATKNLIVDLRGNGGGNSGWSYLLPYFYTQPIKQGHSHIRLSAENVKSSLPAIKAMYEKPTEDPRWKQSYTSEILAEYRKAYEEIPKSRNTFYALPSLTLYSDTVLSKPEKVALIFDDLGGSSTEYFFYISKQSNKVKRYGERTLGMMDYMGVSQETTLPFKGFYLQIPDRKAAWTDSNPTNITGFIPENDLRHLPRSKWIEHIKKDL